MKFTTERTLILLLGLLCSAALVKARNKPALLDIESKDWRMYGGHLQRNFANPVAKGLADSWDVKKGTNVAYSIQLGSRAYGGPVMSGGRVLIGTNNEFPRDPSIKGDKGVMMCFNEKDGTFLWQIVHDKLKAGRVWDWPQQGICSTPCIEGDRFYYVGNRCEVICGDIKTGKIHWKVDMIGKLNVFPHNIATCSPMIVGDKLFLVTSNGVDAAHRRVPAEGSPSFLALDKKNGKVLWSSNLPSQSRRNIMHGQWSNPAYAQPKKGKPQVIFPGGDGWIYSFSLKGDLLWKFDCNPKNAVYRLGGRGTANDFIGTPVIYKDKLYIAVGQDPEHDTGVGHMYCIDITKVPTRKDKDVSPTLVVARKPKLKEKPNPDSAQVWHYGGPVIKGKPSPTGETYYFGRSMSTCAIMDDLLYVTELGGHVHCLDANTGKLYWTESMFANTWASPCVADGKVFVGNDDGIMYVFKHGKKKELIAEIEHEDGTKLRTTPIAANGRLYYMSESPTKLYVIEKGASLRTTKARSKKKVVFLADRGKTGNVHAHAAGNALLAKALENSGLGFKTTQHMGWPKDSNAFEGAACVVIYCNGGNGHLVMKHLDQFQKLIDKGVGIVCMHYGVEVPKGKAGNLMLEAMGGYFETHWSVNPHWKAHIKSLPRHPITNGCKPFVQDDEWYFHMRFQPKMKGVTPILSAHPPKSTMKRRDGPHSNNPHVRKAMAAGEIQHIGWAYERPDGKGRGFGTTGGHYHHTWKDKNWRTLILNAITWTAGLEVPKNGVPSKDNPVKDAKLRK